MNFRNLCGILNLSHELCFLLRFVVVLKVILGHIIGGVIMFNDFSFWEDMYKKNQDMLSSWLDNSKKYEEYAKMFEMFNFFKHQEKMTDVWNSFSKENMPNFSSFEPQFKEWQDVMTSYNPLKYSQMMSKTAGNVYEKMMNSNSFYLNLYEAWQNINREMLEPHSEKFEKEIEKAMKKYDEILIDNFVPMIPKEFQGLFINPYHYIKTLTSSLKEFYAPWKSVPKEISAIYVEAMLKDPSKLSEALALWKKAYDETFGALIKSPVIGSSREAIEQNNKMIDALINFLIVSSEFSSKVNAVATEQSKKAFEEYFELIQEGGEPKTFNEFYKFWSENVEKAIDKYFFTDEFAKMIAFLADSGMKFKMESDKATEKLLEGTPVVTKSEMDSVYKNVYELKKEVKKLKKELEELKKEKKQSTKKTSKK